MNERLNQLHVEAARFAKEKYPSDIVEWSICMSEKFAQLIIDNTTECVRDVLRDENSELTYAACDQVQQRIKQHFGVE